MERGKKDALELLLGDLLEEAKLQTNFSASLDYDRMFTVLRDANFLGTLDIILYDELAPLASSTQRITVPDGFYYLQWKFFIDVSIPWYMFGTLQYAGFPVIVDPSMPAHYEVGTVGYFPLSGFLEYTGLNLHLTENNRYHVLARFAVISTETWDMIKRVFLDQINAFIREQAKKLSGVPY